MKILLQFMCYVSALIICITTKTSAISSSPHYSGAFVIPPSFIIGPKLSSSNNTGRRNFKRFLGLGRLFATAPEVQSFSPEARIPATWEELSSKLEDLQRTNDNEKDKTTKSSTPLVTLYRDTNGWCPFCERVWLTLRIKNIPHQERLINLQNKPDWFTEMVPTGLVPAVMVHDDFLKSNGKNDPNDGVSPKSATTASTTTTTGGSTTSRTLVWESLDIMQTLDDTFPETPRLVLNESKEYREAREIISKVSMTGLQFVYGSRNQTLTETDMSKRREMFESSLDELNNFMGKSNGPFLLGMNVTGVDVEIIPMLERWRYQLPITADLNVMEGRDNIRQWYEAMDEYAPYADRVAGDEYSWTAVASTFLRIFGSGNNGTISAETAAAIERADIAAAKLTDHFGDDDHRDDADGSGGTNSNVFAREAATKIIMNHDAIVHDCTRPDPISQKELVRVSDPITADLTLRAVAEALLIDSGRSLIPPILEEASAFPDAASVARTVAARLCVPRDMGAPAAKILRRTLVKMANVIEKVGAKEVALAKASSDGTFQNKGRDKKRTSITHA